MIGVDRGRCSRSSGCLGAGRASSIGVGAVEHDVARLGLDARRGRAASPSGTPVHLPMQLQPSTQSCRVIWVRDGSARSSASDKLTGRSTRPPTSSRQSAKLVVGERADSRRPADRSCRWRGTSGEMIGLAVFRRQRVRAGEQRAAPGPVRLLGAVEDRAKAQSLCDSWSQPTSGRAPPTAGARARKRRRCRRSAAIGSLIGSLR